MKKVLALFLAFLFIPVFTGTASAIPDSVTVALELENEIVLAGNEIAVYVTFPEEIRSVKAMLLNVSYDSEAMELISGDWLVSGALAIPAYPDWPDDPPVIAFSNATDLSGPVFVYYFYVYEDYEGPCEISLSECSVRQKNAASGAEVEADVTLSPVSFEVVRYIRGDVNADLMVDSDDAIRLLRHCLNPNRYQINQSGDMNGDGRVDAADANYLLFHVFRPDSYPLSQ